MSNLSFVRHVGNGINTQFLLSNAGANIGYFRTTDIHAYVNDKEVTFKINPASPHIAVLDVAPATGTDVLLRREMPVTKPYANFERGNNFGHRQVNNTFVQQLYLTQEMLDGFAPKGFYMKQNTNMGGHKFTNLVDGVNPQDSATMNTVEELDRNQTEWNRKQDSRLVTLESSVTGNSRYINWLYNRGSADGGELIIDVPYNFTSISTVHINGARMTYGLAFDYDTSARTLELAEALEEGDEVVVSIGTEPAIEKSIPSFGYLQSYIDNPQISVGMSFRVIDRADAIFDVVSGLTPNGMNVISATASGYQLKLRVVDASVNIAALGAVAGDNKVDVSPLITHAVRTMKVKDVISVGAHYLLSGLDLTELGDDETGRIKIRNVAGGTATDESTDTFIFRHNENVGIDLTGTSRVVFESLGIKTDTGYSPLVGIYKQRTTTNQSCKRHVFRDCRLLMGETSDSVNDGFGYIGLYNFTGEDNLYDNFTCIADTPNFLTLKNYLNKESPFAGSYTPPDPLTFTVSNNRYRDSSFVSAHGNEPYVLDGVTGLYVNGGYLNARNLARLVRCVGVHSRQIYFTETHCEDIGALLTYDATASVGFSPTTFEFVGGQLIGTNVTTGDRWNGMFEFNTNNLEIRGLKYDIPNRPGSKVIDFIKWTGKNGTLTEVDLRFGSASALANNVYDGLLVSGSVITTNVKVQCGDLDSRVIYNTSHTTPRDLRNIIINGNSNVAFSEFLDTANPADISFTNDSGLVTPSSFFLHVTSVNGVNSINGIVTLGAGDAIGSNFTIRFTNTFFPIRSINVGLAIFTDTNGLFRREITSSFTGTVSLLRMDMDAFNTETKHQAKIECTF